MKILLLQDVRGIGQKNTLVTVPDGFARNNLIPKKLAIPASSAKAKEISNKQSSKDSAKAEKESNKASKLQEIDQLEIKAKTNGKGSLYQSVTAQLLAETIQKKSNVSVKTSDIKFEPSPIKETGEYTISVKANGEVVEIELTVSSE